jgi:hypothetical protein
VPVVVLVYSETLPKAVAKAVASLEPEPRLVYDVMYGERAAMEPMVVTSSMKIKVDEVRLLHGPSAAIMARLALVPLPGLPPMETR